MLYRKFFKPILDFFLSVIGLVLVSPVILVVAILLAFANKGSPFFFQLRPGQGGKIFRLLKFRTMNDRKDKDGKFFSDVNRLTPIGRIIRSASLDEIPQLINVIKGDMSLIGPRPLLVKYLPLYTKTQARRHEVRPGITGWTQVNGRNTLSWRQKFELDIWYVENISFSLDMKILWLTLIKVLKRADINANDTETMKAFTGNE